MLQQRNHLTSYKINLSVNLHSVMLIITTMTTPNQFKTFLLKKPKEMSRTTFTFRSFKASRFQPNWNVTFYFSLLLPTAYVVREEVIFSVCHSHLGGGGGYPGRTPAGGHPLPGAGGHSPAGGCLPPPPHRSNVACTCYAAVGMPELRSDKEDVDIDSDCVKTFKHG